jgi:transposase
VKPFTYWELMIRMRTRSDKFDLRLRIVLHAQTHGVKPTARLFATTAKTVRKWLSRYRQERLQGLQELPRIPLRCPHRTSTTLEQQILRHRDAHPFMGALRLKREFDLPCSPPTIGRILREHSRIHKRRRKHQRKKDLRQIKRRWPLFGQISVDTKHLRDLPHYWPQMKSLGLPKYQFTAREVRSGLMFLGFAQENTAQNACLFVRQIGDHLRACGVPMTRLTFQTDNGSEFIGCFRQDRTRDGFEKEVAALQSRHRRIPPGQWSYNSDVETVHATIEPEFYDIENFDGRADFHRRVASYQAYYNLARPNMGKDNQTPWQIIHQLNPKLDPALVKLPPLMLDCLAPDYLARDELSLRGYDVPYYPWHFTQLGKLLT